MSKAPRLTNKQAAFVREYLIDLNATQAAIRAGYSKKAAASIGAENLRKPHILKKIQEGAAKKEEQAKLDGAGVVEELRKIAMAEAQGEAYNRDGVPFSVKPSISERTRALELLGRHFSIFNDKSEITIKGLELDRLSDDELARLAAGEELDPA